MSILGTCKGPLLATRLNWHIGIKTDSLAIRSKLVSSGCLASESPRPPSNRKPLESTESQPHFTGKLPTLPKNSLLDLLYPQKKALEKSSDECRATGSVESLILFDV